MPIFIPIVVLILIAVLSALLCRVLIAIAPKDAPDGTRKTQTAAVPTSGGLAIAAAVLISFGVVVLLDQASASGRNHFATILRPAFLPYALLCLTVLVVGAIDDRTPLPTRTRLFGVLALTLLVAALSPVFETAFIPFADATLPLPVWFAIGGTALWIFVMMNAVNFIDGSNGMAMGLLMVMLAGLGARFLMMSEPALFVLSAMIAAAMMGFLFWNIPGKLYAGDAGALFGGAVFACLAVFSASDGNIWFPATLALPILIDVFMTLIWRARAGHNILTAHRHHAYQWVIKSGWSHFRVALLYWGLALVCVVLALSAARLSKSASFMVFAGLLGVGILAWALHRRLTPKLAD